MGGAGWMDGALMSHSQLRECHLICRSKLHADSRFPLRLDNFV